MPQRSIACANEVSLKATEANQHRASLRECLTLRPGCDETKSETDSVCCDARLAGPNVTVKYC
eukprot:4607280-Amphidinium_carterae.1